MMVESYGDTLRRARLRHRLGLERTRVSRSARQLIDVPTHGAYRDSSMSGTASDDSVC
jgi:hypothetical protein